MCIVQIKPCEDRKRKFYKVVRMIGNPSKYVYSIFANVSFQKGIWKKAEMFDSEDYEIIETSYMENFKGITMFGDIKSALKYRSCHNMKTCSLGEISFLMTPRAFYHCIAEFRGRYRRRIGKVISYSGEEFETYIFDEAMFVKIV